MSHFIKGQKYKNFVIIKSLYIEELKCRLIEAKHQISQATILHISNNDPENFFSLAFPTYPSNSDGVAHILEHTVLCGSKQFPIKDPFFSMLRRSLNTFMNAMTGPDFTCYPASSQVEKDFYNLLTVYLDSVFFPQLKKESFLQEGHRLEFIDPENPNSGLSYQGIVYNEMKGAMSCVEERMWHNMLKFLTPDLPYAYDSGGSVEEIPSLTHEKLKAFHAHFYHISRCLFFFYGNLSLEKHIDFLEEKLSMQNISPEKPLVMPLQKRFSIPITTTQKYPISTKDIQNATVISFGWLTCPIQDQKTLLSLAILDSIFMDHDASLIKYELLQSTLCSDAYSILETDMSEAPWIFVCKGCDEKNFTSLRKVLFSAIEKISKQGILQKQLLTALHQIEFDRSEVTSPFGLTLFMRSALSKMHNIPLENSLQIHAVFQEITKELHNLSYWTNLIKKYLLQNMHRTDLIMVADPLLEEKENQEEKKRLAKIFSHLTEKEKQDILQQTKDLKKYQKQQEDQSLDCLPKLDIADIPQQGLDLPLTEEKEDSFSFYYHTNFTNNILYCDILFAIPFIETQDLFYLSLFSSLLPEMGAGNRNYQENLEYIQSYTGGIDSYLHTQFPYFAKKNYLPYFGLKGKCLSRNIDKLFSLFIDILQDIDLTDKKRLAENLQQQYTFLSQSLTSHAMRYAIEESMHGFSEINFLSYQHQGLPYFLNLKKILQEKDAIEKIVVKLQNLKERIFSQKDPKLLISCEKPHIETLKQQKFFSLSKVSFPKEEKWKNFPLPSKEASKRAYIISAPVAFTVMGLCLDLTYDNPNSAYMLLAAKLCEHLVLHKEIREERGAYGARAYFSPLNGNFYFYSYRDPCIAATIDTFYKAIEQIQDKKFTAQDIEEAKFSIIQNIDSPIAVERKAFSAFSWKSCALDKKLRNTLRQNILTATKEQIQQAVVRYLLPKISAAHIVTFAGENLIKKENTLLKKAPFLLHTI